MLTFNPADASTQGAKPLFDILIASVNLSDIIDSAGSVGT